jgi:hypothetical protein
MTAYLTSSVKHSQNFGNLSIFCCDSKSIVLLLCSPAAFSQHLVLAESMRLSHIQVKRFIGYLCLSVLSFAAFSQSRKPSQSPGAAVKISFAKDIEPVLESNCYPCHNANRSSGGLRLDDERSALSGGSSGAAIIRGKSSNSLLMQRLLGLNHQARMPLGKNPLPKSQIDLIARWIDQGAVWGEKTKSLNQQVFASPPNSHWAYNSPVRPNPPQVKNPGWVRNPLDRFILARLEKEGLQPSPEAPKESLIRRLYLDLTGLPPSPQEVDQFVADQSSKAFEELVDRLLASKHFGERWARPWLDLARYADTNGYEKDNRRVMWKYRDWVINALNQDMPFDQFTVEQLAGDMLPNATVDQQIATGFHRNTLLNQEGGVDPEEARWETIIDRVNTTATVWLGSTIGCAQCHNHKYDPFTQKDYYKLFAFFDNGEYEIQGSASERWVKEPSLALPTPEQAAKRDEYREEIARLETVLKTPTQELQKQQEDWERNSLEAAKDWTALEPLEYQSAAGATLTKLADNSILVSGELYAKDIYTVVLKTAVSGITAVRLEALPDTSLPRGGPGRDAYGNFAIYGFEAQIAPQNQATNHTKVVFADAASDAGSAKNLLRNNGSSWAIEATNDSLRLPRQALFITDQPLGFQDGTLLEIKIKHNHPTLKQNLGRFRISVATSKNPAAVASIPATLRPLVLLPVAERTPEQRDRVTQYFLTQAPSLKAQRDRLNEVNRSQASLNIPSAEVLRERQNFERPFTYLRIRGSFLNPGEKVYADVPASLHRFPENQMPNRLGLARWLVAPSNPLVARVVVNRFWEQIFGRGIVETSEDFGTQGQTPSHTELLDYLAVEFMQGAGGAKPWSQKAIIRLLVTSATYRQSSKATPAMLERDPYNRLLERGPRFRLEAEMIRDLSLAASGLLNPSIGGPSVFPIQPEGIWNTPYSNDRWLISAGNEKFRRSLYTFIRRTAPYPMFTTFDAPSRELCLVRRVRTNTPLQALTTLNDEAFLVAARALARRLIAEGGIDFNSRIAYGFRLCTARRPNQLEVLRLSKLYEIELARFTAEPLAARQLLKEDEKSLDDKQLCEMAAWTLIANVLLNLDETLTRE